MSIAAPQTVLLKDYMPPGYLVNSIDLRFELKEPFTMVKSHMDIARDSSSNSKDFMLYGEELVLDSILLNKKTLNT